MPTIVYQTNRYWLSCCERWLARQCREIPRDIFFYKITFLMTRKEFVESWWSWSSHYFLLQLHIKRQCVGTFSGSIFTNQVKLLKIRKAKKRKSVPHCDKVNGPCQQILPSLKKDSTHKATNWISNSLQNLTPFESSVESRYNDSEGTFFPLQICLRLKFTRTSK